LSGQEKSRGGGKKTRWGKVGKNVVLKREVKKSGIKYRREENVGYVNERARTN